MKTVVTTNMVRPNGWSSRGVRLVGHFPLAHWETMTFVAGFRQTGIVAHMVIKGAMNGQTFLAAYIEQSVVPTLKRRDIVVIDNVPFHKAAVVQKAMEGVGATQAFLRKAAERTIDGLNRSIGSLVRALARSQFVEYFKHAGYESV
jgi:hypothetical protein